MNSNLSRPPFIQLSKRYIVGFFAQLNFAKRIKGLVSKVLRRKPNGLKPFFENEENDMEI